MERNAFSAWIGQRRRQPSDKLVKRERIGKVPHENDARALTGGGSDGGGSFASGFSQTCTPPFSVLILTQPFRSKTGTYLETFTNPQRTPCSPAFCRIGSSFESPSGNQNAVSIWPMPLERSSARLRAVW